MPGKTVLDFIGNTPMLSLDFEEEGDEYRVYAKCEFLNPSGSVKDRIAKFIVEQAERRGLLKRGGTIVEATSGNTGISLAMVAAAKGYRMLVVMPEHMTKERITILENLGAQVCLTPKEESFTGAVRKAEEIGEKTEGAFLTRQFQNESNVEAHFRTTGPEVYSQSPKPIAAFVAGIGTGGTLMGVGRFLKARSVQTKVVAVEPEEAALLSGRTDMKDHAIAGIGDGFIPEIVRTEEIDEVARVASDEAIATARAIHCRFGLMIGISAGANVRASIDYQKRHGKGVVVTVLPDRAERYFSTGLYCSQGDGKVRQCSKDCECVFL